MQHHPGSKQTPLWRLLPPFEQGAIGIILLGINWMSYALESLVRVRQGVRYMGVGRMVAGVIAMSLSSVLAIAFLAPERSVAGLNIIYWVLLLNFLIRAIFWIYGWLKDNRLSEEVSHYMGTSILYYIPGLNKIAPPLMYRAVEPVFWFALGTLIFWQIDFGIGFFLLSTSPCIWINNQRIFNAERQLQLDMQDAWLESQHRIGRSNQDALYYPPSKPIEIVRNK